MFACEIVTAAPPVLVNVSERLVLLLVCTLPKESVDDDAARVGETYDGFAPFLSRRAQY